MMISVIILMVAWQIPVLGMLMAIGGVVTWLVVPIFKVFNHGAKRMETGRRAVPPGLGPGFIRQTLDRCQQFLPHASK